jgi:hypothetical protein
MEIFGALIRTVLLYLAIGLVAAGVNAVAFQATPVESQAGRAVAVTEDVVLWPRFLIGFAVAVDGRLAALPVEDQPFLYSLLRGPYTGGEQP